MSGTERWWSDETPSLKERAIALGKVLLSGRFEHELRSTIGVRPSSRPLGEQNFVHLDVYKIWYVLHYDKIDEERTTNLHIRKIGRSTTSLEGIHGSSIDTHLLPIENGEWQSVHTDGDQS